MQNNVQRLTGGKKKIQLKIIVKNSRKSSINQIYANMENEHGKVIELVMAFIMMIGTSVL